MLNILLRLVPYRFLHQCALCLLLTTCTAVNAAVLLSTTNGMLEGTKIADSNVIAFKGIPFAAPPVGDLRWQSPQAVKPWVGKRDATKFSDQCMQLPLFSDMQFRSSGMSEDCLYLNIWTPNTKPNQALPVLLYFYGGGFVAGDGSEPRYDGANMASKDIVVITANYRLGVFGLLAHAELSSKTSYKGSGNYTFMDQTAALKWAIENIAAFGGDSSRITIAGESAGSLAVSALMASPLSKDLIGAAIGQSGSLLGPTLPTLDLKEAEQVGEDISIALGEGKPLNLEELRAMSAQLVLERSAKSGIKRFMPTIDGYVFPESPLQLFSKNLHAQVPLLAGSNSQEGSFSVLLKPSDFNHSDAIATVAYDNAIRKLYPKEHERVLTLYPASTSIEIMDAAQALASDRFIGFATWNWIDLATTKSKQPSYYYKYSKIRPAPKVQNGKANTNKISDARGAVHSAEIEYALGNLDTHNAYYWDEDDYKVSRIMQAYFANFIKTGNPNGPDLPLWPLFSDNKQININVETKAEDTRHLRKRYLFHREYFGNK